MAEKAKNLRKTLSKNRIQKQQSLNENNQAKNETSNFNPLRQSSPLQQPDFLTHNQHTYQPSMPLSEVDPLKYFDLMNSNSEEKKKEKEKQMQILEELNNLQIPKENSSKKEENNTQKTNNLLSRMKKTKEEKGPLKVLAVFEKRIEEQENPPPKEESPEKEKVPGKLMPELDDKKKNRLLLRMSSAKQGLSKNIIGKAMIKKASEAILEKAKNLENKISKDNIQTFEELNKHISNDNYVLRDTDVQKVEESDMIAKPENKQIDIASFMNKENDK